MSIILPQGSRDDFHSTWSELEFKMKIYTLKHMLYNQIISCETNIVNGRVQPLHTYLAKLIEFESHGVFYLNMDSTSNCSHEQVWTKCNLIGSAAREDASAKSTKDSTHGPGVRFFSNKGEVIYCKIVQERPYKVSLWIRCSMNSEHRECRIIQNNGSIKSNLWGDDIYKKIQFFLYIFLY